MKNWIPWVIVGVLALFIMSDKLFFERRESERFNAEIAKLTKAEDSLRLLMSMDSLLIEVQAANLRDATEMMEWATATLKSMDSLYIAELKRLGVYNTTNNHARVKDIILWRNPRPVMPDSL